MHTWQVTPFLFVYLAAFVTSLLLAWVSWRRRPTRGEPFFTLLALSSACWIGGYVLGFFNTDLAWKLGMLRLEYLGVIATNLSWLLFAATYTQNDRWINRRTLALLAVVPVLTYVQVLFVDQHELFYRSFGVTTRDGLVISSKLYGPGFVLWTAWGYVMFFVATMMLIHRAATMPRHLRGMSGILVLVALVLVVSNALYLSGNNPIAPYDPTPLSFSIAGLLLLVSMRLHRFLDIVPVAHDLVFEDVRAGVLIADERGILIETNPVAERWLGRDEKSLIGARVCDVLPLTWPPSGIEDDETHEVDLETQGESRVLELRVAPMLDRRQRVLGHVLLLYDVTERKNLEGEQQRLIRELSDALAQIRTLRGMLPICAGCKRIRDDEGTWTRIETYIRDRSEADFTHGICPECSAGLLRDLEARI